MTLKHFGIVICFMAILPVTLVTSCKKEIADVEKLQPEIKIDTLDRPIEVKASKGSFGKKVVISWIPIPLATNYQIFRFDEKVGKYSMIGQGPDTSFVDLFPNEAYKKTFYKVKVVNSENAFSNFSDIDYGYASGKNFTKYLSFGYQGNAPGLFGFAMHVAVDKTNNIYVSDEGNNRVQKFDRKGNFMEIFYNGTGARGMAFLKNGNAVVTRVQSSPSYIQIFDSQKKLVKEWGNYGLIGDYQFGNIEEITVDDQDNIYIIDGINNYVKKFDRNGRFLLKFEAATRVADQPDKAYPFGICILNDKVFVTSPRNGLIRIFDKEGKYLKSWNLGSTSHAIKAFGNHLYINCEGYIMKTDENGEIREKIGLGDISSQIPGLAVNSEEEIIVSEVYSRAIKIFKKI